MSIRPDGPAPYAPVHPVVSLLEAYRNRGLATPFTVDVLIRAGVTESLAPRTLQAMKLLDLVDDVGNPTAQFEALRRARGEDEYKICLREWLTSVYADVLQFADPATDSTERLSEAFRGYEPPGQRPRMVTLMIGLFEYAGLVSEGSKRTGRRPNNSSGAAKQRAPKQPTQVIRPASIGPSAEPAVDDLPPGLVGLLRQIPKGGAGWTEQRRDEFLAAFSAVLNFSVPILDAPGMVAAEEEDEA